MKSFRRTHEEEWGIRALQLVYQENDPAASLNGHGHAPRHKRDESDTDRPYILASWRQFSLIAGTRSVGKAKLSGPCTLDIPQVYPSEFHSCFRAVQRHKCSLMMNRLPEGAWASPSIPSAVYNPVVTLCQCSNVTSAGSTVQQAFCQRKCFPGSSSSKPLQD